MHSKTQSVIDRPTNTRLKLVWRPLGFLVPNILCWNATVHLSVAVTTPAPLWPKWNLFMAAFSNITCRSSAHRLLEHDIRARHGCSAWKSVWAILKCQHHCDERFHHLVESVTFTAVLKSKGGHLLHYGTEMSHRRKHDFRQCSAGEVWVVLFLLFLLT